MFGAITRTIDGHGDADSWSLSKSQRSQVMGSERWDIEQEMTINQHEDFDGSMVYTKSPKVELVEGLPALKYDESLVTDINASGEYNPSDHVVVKQNGAVIYDAVQGTPLPYDHPTDAIAFDDLFDTVGNIAPRVGPSHGPGGEAAQVFAGATVFPGDNPGTTASSLLEFPAINQEPNNLPPASDQSFRPWKTSFATYDNEGHSYVRLCGILLTPEEPAPWDEDSAATLLDPATTDDRLNAVRESMLKQLNAITTEMFEKKWSAVNVADLGSYGKAVSDRLRANMPTARV